MPFTMVNGVNVYTPDGNEGQYNGGGNGGGVSNGGGGVNTGNGGGRGILGTFNDITNGAFGFTGAARGVGQAAGALGEVFGLRSQPFGGGYAGLERNQVRLGNSALNAYANQYDRFGQFGGGFGGFGGGFGGGGVVYNVGGFGGPVFDGGFGGGQFNGGFDSRFNGGQQRFADNRGFEPVYDEQRYAPSRGYQGGRSRQQSYQDSRGYAEPDNYVGDDYVPQNQGRQQAAGGNATDLQKQFVLKVYNAHVHGSQPEMEQAVKFAYDSGIVARDGNIHFGSFEYNLPSGQSVVFNGEVQTPEFAARHHSEFLTNTFGIAQGSQPQSGQQTPPPAATTTTAPATTTTSTAPATTATTSTSPAVTAPAAIPAASGSAAAFHGHKKSERIPLAQNQVHDVQLLLLANKKSVGGKIPGQPDDKNGDVTQDAIKTLAAELGMDAAAIKKMNFQTNSPEAQQFTKLAQENAAKLKAPAQATPTQPTVTPEQQAAAARATQQQQAAQRAEAEERTRPRILVDLPNDLRGRATIKNLVGLASMTSGSGEEIEFNGPQGQNKDILKDYVRFVRTTMDARGMRTSGESAKETAGMILAAYNGVSTSDTIGDLTRVRMPNQNDIVAAVDRMSQTVLNDGRIQSREFKLPAAVLQDVVNPVLPPSMQAAYAKAQAQGIPPLPGANPRNADGTGVQGAGAGGGQPLTR